MNTPTTQSNSAPRWHERFTQFCNALATLAEVVPHAQNLNELEQDGLLQRFEFTFELAWKVMQDYLPHIGQSHIKEPRLVITEMANNNFIDPFLWDEMLTARNRLSHLYSKSQSRAYVRAIVSDYAGVLEDFRQTMQTLHDNITASRIQDGTP